MAAAVHAIWADMAGGPDASVRLLAVKDKPILRMALLNLCGARNRKYRDQVKPFLSDPDDSVVFATMYALSGMDADLAHSPRDGEDAETKASNAALVEYWKNKK
jgi:hypothetical protein